MFSLLPNIDPSCLCGHEYFSSKKIRACHGPFVWAGPGRAETFENLMNRAGPGCENLKMCDGLGRAVAHPLKFWWAGPGRCPSSEKLIGRAGPRPILSKFDGPGRTAAHEMRCTSATTTTTTTTRTSTVPMRPPTCFDGPARAVVHEMWCTTAAPTIFLGAPGSLFPQNSYSYLVRSYDAFLANRLGCII